MNVREQPDPSAFVRLWRRVNPFSPYGEWWWGETFVRRRVITAPGLGPREKRRLMARRDKRMMRWLECRRLEKTLPTMLRSAEMRGRALNG
jgi:hypothetical protein